MITNAQVQHVILNVPKPGQHTARLKTANAQKVIMSTSDVILGKINPDKFRLREAPSYSAQQLKGE